MPPHPPFDPSAVATRLWGEHRDRQPFRSVDDGIGRLSAAQGYAVQRALVGVLRAERGDRIVGYKIGLTSAAMQVMCGIDSPVYGCILESRVHDSGVTLDLDDFGRLGIEFEIAVRVGGDVASLGPQPTIEAIATCVDAICPALEMIDDRAADYGTLDAASLVADNAWNAGIVLGQWQALPPDLARAAGRVFCDGRLVDEGRVGDALDHPFASIAWLAAELAETGDTLAAGSIVMTGSIVKTCFPTHGQAWRYSVEGLGDVEARTAAART